MPPKFPAVCAKAACITHTHTHTHTHCNKANQNTRTQTTRFKDLGFREYTETQANKKDNRRYRRRRGLAWVLHPLSRPPATLEVFEFAVCAADTTYNK